MCRCFPGARPERQGAPFPPRNAGRGTASGFLLGDAEVDARRLGAEGRDMGRFILLAVLVALAACGVAHQPESNETVAAFEVPLPTPDERSEFLILVRQEAEAEGLHLDSASAAELDRTADAIPIAAMTIHAAVWRGSNDDQLEASIMDQHDHLGQVWIMFSKGEDPTLSRRFRERLMQKVFERWPDTLSLPIMPTGAVPLHRDLRRTPDGYEVDPAAAARYGRKASSAPRP